MLVTNGFGFLLAINWAWLLLPVLLFFVSMCVVSWLDARRIKAGKESYDQVGTPGFHKLITVLSGCMLLAIPLTNLAWGFNTHYGDIAEDIEEQFHLEHVHHQYIGDYPDWEGKWVAKDPEGLFVICDTKETRSEDTFKLECDSGKDYSKGLPL